MQPLPQQPWAKSPSDEQELAVGFRKQLTALPNLLTLARVLPIPAIYLCLRQGAPFYEGFAFALIVVALSTDFLDGYVARRQGLKTQLGLMLDPTADKLLTSSLAVMGAMFKGLPVWMAAVVVVKDLLVFAGAVVIFLRRGLVFPADRWGRTTTLVASVGLILCFILPPPYSLYAVGLVIGCIAVSALAYGRKFVRLLWASGPAAFLS
ncbi:MAG: CDP-alcohol phosphatidyltransferase family protein [Candidatus Latescibacteria bacterium]|nr:CDP-alcohol phosphatidyltransferase family protein [Candidatus Latescibacterota bacterium]